MKGVVKHFPKPLYHVLAGYVPSIIVNEADSLSKLGILNPLPISKRNLVGNGLIWSDERDVFQELTLPGAGLPR